MAQSVQNHRQIYIELPKKSAIPTLSSTPSAFIVQVTEFNEFFLQDKIMSFEALKKKLKLLKSSQPHLSLIVSGDQNSNLGQTLRILNLAQELKIRSIKIETAQPHTPKKKKSPWIRL